MCSVPLAIATFIRIISVVTMKTNGIIVKKQSKSHHKVESAASNDLESAPIIEESAMVMFDEENNDN